MANAPKFGIAYKNPSPDKMNKPTALSLIADFFIDSKLHPKAEDFDIVAAALRDDLPEASDHAAAVAANLREAARNQLTLRGILQEAVK